MKTLGQRIRNRRLELDMTQDELSKKMGYKNKSTIGKIESDVNDITSSKIEAKKEAPSRSQGQ